MRPPPVGGGYRGGGHMAGAGYCPFNEAAARGRRIQNKSTSWGTGIQADTAPSMRPPPVGGGYTVTRWDFSFRVNLQ